MALSYPDLNPIALSLGPLTVRWYGLAYVAGIFGGFFYGRTLIRKGFLRLKEVDFTDFMPWAVLGIIVGGRLGYGLFYHSPHYRENPLDLLQIWKPGMSFHGGLLGVVLVVLIFCWKRRLSWFFLADAAAVATPIGLGLGRLANFVNAELYGRVTDVPWGMIFPHGGPLPRHPSQLYEAFLEGFVLWVILAWLVMRTRLAHTRPGFLAGIFAVGYALSRLLVECVREPDAHLGYVMGLFTYGQMLTLPLMGIGLWLVARTPSKVK
jgi:phosphatidylglycerol:prolipoprotein diacylglycerol transferase